MKTQFQTKRYLAILMTSTLLLAGASLTSANASGRSAVPALNTILSGKGAPASSLGSNGDFYIDSNSLNFYGPKAKNRWPLPLSLKGPAGPAGAEGKASKNSGGATITNAASVIGPKGETGATGPKGEKGERGEKGEKGEAGLAGASGFGSPGATGPAGPAGPAGANGSNGATGAQGVQGQKGETGTAISSSKYGAITFASPINAPFSFQDSNAFGSFLAGGSYVIDVYIYTTFADGTTPNLGISFMPSGGLRIVQSNYIVTSGSSFRTGAVKNETSAIARLLVTIDSNINPKITVRASSSTATSGNVQSLSGYFTESEVGTVS